MAGPGNPNNPCERCQSQWVNGQPPTEPTQAILDIIQPPPEPQPRGLGDTIATITHATGIAQAVEYVSGKLGVDCGCKKRQEALNKLVPYKDKE